MAPKGKSVADGTQFARIKVAACQYAKCEFECTGNIICLATRLPEGVDRSILRRHAAVLTVADAWQAIKADKQKIPRDVAADTALRLTTDQDRNVPLEDTHELHEADACLALGYPKTAGAKKAPKSSKAASSGAAGWSDPHAQPSA